MSDNQNMKITLTFDGDAKGADLSISKLNSALSGLASKLTNTAKSFEKLNTVLEQSNRASINAVTRMVKALTDEAALQDKIAQRAIRSAAAKQAAATRSASTAKQADAVTADSATRTAATVEQAANRIVAAKKKIAQVAAPPIVDRQAADDRSHAAVMGKMKVHYTAQARNADPLNAPDRLADQDRAYGEIMASMKDFYRQQEREGAKAAAASAAADRASEQSARKVDATRKAALRSAMSAQDKLAKMVQTSADDEVKSAEKRAKAQKTASGEIMRGLIDEAGAFDLLGRHVASQLFYARDALRSFSNAGGIGTGLLSLGVGLLASQIERVGEKAITAGEAEQKANADLATAYDARNTSLQTFGGLIDATANKMTRWGVNAAQTKEAFARGATFGISPQAVAQGIPVVAAMAKRMGISFSAAFQKATEPGIGMSRFLKDAGVVVPAALQNVMQKAQTPMAKWDAFMQAMQTRSGKNLFLGQLAASSGNLQDVQAHLSASMDNLYGKLGLLILPTVARIVDKVAGLVDYVNKVADAVGPLVQQFGGLLGALAGVGGSIFFVLLIKAGLSLYQRFSRFTDLIKNAVIPAQRAQQDATNNQTVATEKLDESLRALPQDLKVLITVDNKQAMLDKDAFMANVGAFFAMGSTPGTNLVTLPVDIMVADAAAKTALADDAKAVEGLNGKTATLTVNEVAGTDTADVPADGSTRTVKINEEPGTNTVGAPSSPDVVVIPVLDPAKPLHVPGVGDISPGTTIEFPASQEPEILVAPVLDPAKKITEDPIPLKVRPEIDPTAAPLTEKPIPLIVEPHIKTGKNGKPATVHFPDQTINITPTIVTELTPAQKTKIANLQAQILNAEASKKNPAHTNTPADIKRYNDRIAALQKQIDALHGTAAGSAKVTVVEDVVGVELKKDAHFQKTEDPALRQAIADDTAGLAGTAKTVTETVGTVKLTAAAGGAQVVEGAGLKNQIAQDLTGLSATGQTVNEEISAVNVTSDPKGVTAHIGSDVMSSINAAVKRGNGSGAKTMTVDRVIDAINLLAPKGGFTATESQALKNLITTEMGKQGPHSISTIIESVVLNAPKNGIHITEGAQFGTDLQAAITSATGAVDATLNSARVNITADSPTNVATRWNSVVKPTLQGMLKSFGRGTGSALSFGVSMGLAAGVTDAVMNPQFRSGIWGALQSVFDHPQAGKISPDQAKKMAAQAVSEVSKAKGLKIPANFQVTNKAGELQGALLSAAGSKDGKTVPISIQYMHDGKKLDQVVNVNVPGGGGADKNQNKFSLADAAGNIGQFVMSATIFTGVQMAAQKVLGGIWDLLIKGGKAALGTGAGVKLMQALKDTFRKGGGGSGTPGTPAANASADAQAQQVVDQLAQDAQAGKAGGATDGANGTGDVLGSVKSTAQNIAKAFVGDFSLQVKTTLTDAKTVGAVALALGGIVLSALGLIGSMMKGSQTLAPAVVGLHTNIIALMGGLAVDLIVGLGDGIKKHVADLASVGQDIVNSVVQGIKDHLPGGGGGAAPHGTTTDSQHYQGYNRTSTTKSDAVPPGFERKPDTRKGPDGKPHTYYDLYDPKTKTDYDKATRRSHNRLPGLPGSGFGGLSAVDPATLRQLTQIITGGPQTAQRLAAQHTAAMSSAGAALGGSTGGSIAAKAHGAASGGAHPGATVKPGGASGPTFNIAHLTIQANDPQSLGQKLLAIAHAAHK